MNSAPSVDQAALQAAIRAHLTEICKRLDDAADIARAAEALAISGNTEEAVRIAVGVEPLTYEADRLLSAATVLRKLSEE